MTYKYRKMNPKNLNGCYCTAAVMTKNSMHCTVATLYITPIARITVVNAKQPTLHCQ
jgi:hypothetical protein